MNTYIKEGDTIVGDTIVGEARKMIGPTVIVSSGRHRAMRIVLKENARCRIEKKLRFIR